jgi:hypothetical protein
MLAMGGHATASRSTNGGQAFTSRVAPRASAGGRAHVGWTLSALLATFLVAAAVIPVWGLPDGIVPVAMTGDRTDYGEILSLSFPVRIEELGAAFSARLRDGDQENFCFFVPTPDDVRCVLRAGQEMPGIPGSQLAGYVPNLRARPLAFAGFVRAGEEESIVTGIWAADQGYNLRLLARLNHSSNTDGPGYPPGVPAGARYQTIHRLAGHESGRVYLAAELAQQYGGASFANAHGLWGTRPDGSLALIARQGDPIPGRPDAKFTGFDNLAATDTGIAFTSAETLFLKDDTTGIVEVARRGQPPPGVAGTDTLLSFANVLAVETGKISFVATVWPSSRRVLYRWEPGTANPGETSLSCFCLRDVLA